MTPGGNSEARRAVRGRGDTQRASRTARAASGVLSQRAAAALSIMMAAVVWAATPGPSAIGQTQTRRGFWTGLLEVSVLRCSEICGPYELGDQGIVAHDPNSMVSYYTYNVYQNDRGLVRHELISANTGGVNEQGRGAQIVDYAQGYLMVFDPGAPQAIRVPLVFPETTSTALGSRKILGFTCSGVRMKWVQRRNHYSNVRETWTASEVDFRDPLLSVNYGYDARGELVIVEMSAIRSLKTSPALLRSLFELPAGMGVYVFREP